MKNKFVKNPTKKNNIILNWIIFFILAIGIYLYTRFFLQWKFIKLAYSIDGTFNEGSTPSSEFANQAKLFVYPLYFVFAFLLVWIKDFLYRGRAIAYPLMAYLLYRIVFFRIMATAGWVTIWLGLYIGDLYSLMGFLFIIGLIVDNKKFKRIKTKDSSNNDLSTSSNEKLVSINYKDTNSNVFKLCLFVGSYIVISSITSNIIFPSYIDDLIISKMQIEALFGTAILSLACYIMWKSIKKHFPNNKKLVYPILYLTAMKPIVLFFLTFLNYEIVQVIYGILIIPNLVIAIIIFIYIHKKESNKKEINISSKQISVFLFIVSIILIFSGILLTFI